MIRLTHDPIVADELLAAVHDPACGAVVLFLGTVRASTGDELTLALEYEAYAPMAQRKIAEIVAELSVGRPQVTFAVVHRLGRLEIGAAAVAVAVAAPHRAEAFELCRTAMDRIKEHVPIWKKDHTPTGESSWVLPAPASEIR